MRLSASAAPTRSVLVCEPERGKPLTRCPVCGYGRNVGAVQEFTARTASAITATAFSLHRGLAQQSDDVMLRRLLVFADSRQDTAFQAGYIRGRSRAVQVRRLITQAVLAREAQGRPSASFDGLVKDVFRTGRDIGLYEDPAGRDAANRVRRVCEWDILGEVASDERRPPTLERLGMITIGYPVWGSNIGLWLLTWGSRDLSGGSVVLVDQSVEDRSASEPLGREVGWRWLG